MLGKAFKELLVGGLMFAAGMGFFAFGDSRSDTGLRWTGGFLAALGAGFCIVAAIAGLKPLFGRAAAVTEGVIRERACKKAQVQLLRYKLLLNEGILSQDEYDRKAQELKGKIL